MFKRFLVSASAMLFVGSITLATPVFAQAAKTAKDCAAEYQTQKPALKAAKEKKAEFIAACRSTPIGTPTPISAAAPPSSAPTAAPARRAPSAGGLKTAGACNDEYKANKDSLKSAKEKKKDFIEACRALPPGTATPIGSGAAAAPPPSAPAGVPAPAPVSPSRTTAPAPAPSSATSPTSAPAPSAPSTPSGANQFSTEATAKGHCPSGTVVWLNTKSGVYHYAGKRDYGHTKEGAYMCESDATAAGNRASKNGQ